jgi:hypothetical protein
MNVNMQVIAMGISNKCLAISLKASRTLKVVKYYSVETTSRFYALHFCLQSRGFICHLNCFLRVVHIPATPID